MIYPTLDVFFTAAVESFAEARAMPEVLELVRVAPANLEFGEIAFPSVEQALRLYVDRIHGG